MPAKAASVIRTSAPSLSPYVTIRGRPPPDDADPLGELYGAGVVGADHQQPDGLPVANRWKPSA